MMYLILMGLLWFFSLPWTWMLYLLVFAFIVDCVVQGEVNLYQLHREQEP